MLDKLLTEYRAAQRRATAAAENCPHWDYETAGHAGQDCCEEYSTALMARKAARAVWQKEQS